MKGAPTVPPGRARPSGRQRAARAGLLLGLLALLVGLPGAAEATRVGPAAVCPPAATAGAEVAPAAPQPATSLPPCGDGHGSFLTTPGASIGKAQSRAASVSAT